MVKNKSSRRKVRVTATAENLKEIAECSRKTEEKANRSKYSESSTTRFRLTEESNSEPDSSPTAEENTSTTPEVNLISFSETSILNNTAINDKESTTNAQVSIEKNLPLKSSEDEAASECTVQEDLKMRLKNSFTKSNEPESTSEKCVYDCESSSAVCETQSFEDNIQNTSKVEPDEKNAPDRNYEQNVSVTAPGKQGTSSTRKETKQKEIQVCKERSFEDTTPRRFEPKPDKNDVQSRSKPHISSIIESGTNETCSTNKESTDLEEIPDSRVKRSDENVSYKNLYCSITEDTASSKVDPLSSLLIKKTFTVEVSNNELYVSQEIDGDHEKSEGIQKVDEDYNELDVCHESKQNASNRRNTPSTGDGKPESQSRREETIGISSKKSIMDIFLLDKPDERPAHFLTAEATMSITALMFVTVFTYALITNYREIGTVFRAPHYFHHKARGDFGFTWPIVFVLCIPFFHIISLGIEKALLKGAISETLGAVAYISNTLFVLVFPIICFKYLAATNEVYRLIIIVMYIYTVMKILSFWKWNWGKRQTWKQQTTVKLTGKRETVKNPQITYPENLCINNIMRYSIVPNYCYQPEFPRRPFKATRMLKTLAVSYLQTEIATNLIEHFVTPVLKDYTEDWGFFNWSSMDQFVDELRTVIIISPIMALIVLTALNATLYGTLNMLAEFSGYDHNGFSGDWWNALDMQQYWNRWNYPVHDFLREMVYIPIKTRWSLSRFQCNVVVFFVSGIFHDYGVMGIIGNYYAVWVTLSMILQAVNIEATNYLRKNFKYGTIIANMLVITIWPVGCAGCFLFIYKKNVLS